MSRRAERRQALEQEVAERKEELDGLLAQAEELELPPAPTKFRQLQAEAVAPLELEPSPESAGPESLRGATPRRQGRVPKRRPEDYERELAELEVTHPPPPPQEPEPVRPQPKPQTEDRSMSTPKQDPNKITAYPEIPHEKIQEFISSGYGPTVFGEVRRVQPGGGTITIKKNIMMPITSYPDLGEKMAYLLAGGGTLIVSLAQNKNERPFVSWKEGYEMPPRAVPRELTLGFNADTGEFEVVQLGLDAMGGVAIAGGSLGAVPAGAWGSTPPVPQGPAAVLSPPGLPPFPAPQRDAAGRLLAPPEAITEPWMRRYPAEQQWQMARQTYSERYGVALPDLSAASVALRWNDREAREVEQARTQAARYEERLDATRDRSQALLESERTARAGLERQVAELRAQMMAKEQAAEASRREAEFRAKMELLEMKISQASQPKTNGEETIKTIATLATALAPVAVAYVQTSKQQAAAEIQAREEFQRTLLAGLTQPKPSGLGELTPLIAALAPVAAPMLQQWMANNDPEKLDEAKHNQDQRNLMFMKFMFDMMQAQMGGGEEPEPFWFRFLKELAPQLMGLGKVAMLEASRNGGALPPGPPRRQDPLPPPSPGQTQVLNPQDVPPAPVVAPPPTTSYALDVSGTVQRYAEINPEAAQMLGLILSELAKTPGAQGFLTPEWAAILFHIHAKGEPEEVANLIADHLEHSRLFALIPPPISNIFADPKAALMGIIPALPIWMFDQPYAEKVVELTVEEITSREKERVEAAREMDEESSDDASDDEEEDESEDESEEVVEAKADVVN